MYYYEALIGVHLASPTASKNASQNDRLKEVTHYSSVEPNFGDDAHRSSTIFFKYSAIDSAAKVIPLDLKLLLKTILRSNGETGGNCVFLVS
jgi:hypothetical protein